MAINVGSETKLKFHEKFALSADDNDKVFHKRLVLFMYINNTSHNTSHGSKNSIDMIVQLTHTATPRDRSYY